VVVGRGARAKAGGGQARRQEAIYPVVAARGSGGRRANGGEKGTPCSAGHEHGPSVLKQGLLGWFYVIGLLFLFCFSFWYFFFFKT
jgi:hypothetical protein